MIIVAAIIIIISILWWFAVGWFVLFALKFMATCFANAGRC